MKYPKIQTIFKRGDDGIIIPNDYTLPEFEYLKDCKWEATEKIDGTNIRIELKVSKNIDDTNKFIMTIKGRQEESIIPKHLEKKLHEIFDDVNWSSIFPNMIVDDEITIYGEGYGHKIQTPGNRYLADNVNFILFDIRINHWWLKREALTEIANQLNLRIVPIIGLYTLKEAIGIVSKGFKSTISEDESLDAEGLVLRTPVGLKDRSGERLILKLKTKDFRKLEKKLKMN